MDRLSALIDRFELTVMPAGPQEANLVILHGRDEAHPWRWLFYAKGPACVLDCALDDLAFAARVDWGGSGNPLLTALPERIEREVEAHGDMAGLIGLLVGEWHARRCGSASVLNRLAEVLIVRILREALERGTTEPGILGGLADPRLSRAIVAMHEAPGRAWRAEDLASTAGLSRSRFAQIFTQAVGETPLAYLRRWRLSLARQDLERGARVQTVARRYGYASGEALHRALHKRFEMGPLEMRKRAMRQK